MRATVLLDLDLKVQLKEDAVILQMGSAQSQRIAIPTRLVRRGSDVRLALTPGAEPTRDPDPILLKLVAQARAAQMMVESG